ncbi:MAG TPA: hypothetical protein VLB12_17450 [Gemmatimonadales bacterium]|nr:hypothetical protein [Gemmatimonadales bacterium]
MRSAMMVWVSLVGVGGLTMGRELESQNSPDSPPVREIALDTLHDVAVAIYDPKGSLIYYNPAYLQRLGPQLSAFFMTHEYGHLALRHTRSHALAGKRKSFNAKLQEQELAADCYATGKLAADNPSAVEAAIHFFTRMGPFSYDAAHPSGSQRAAKILSCIPRVAKRVPTDAAASPGGDSLRSSGTDVGITVTAPVHSERIPWQEIHFRIGNLQSAVSNLHQPRAVALQTLPPGTYDYELRVNVFYLDDQFQLNPSGSIVGSGSITVQGGEILRVESSPSGPARLVLAE